jgi:hypothetical protein
VRFPKYRYAVLTGVVLGVLIPIISVAFVSWARIVPGLWIIVLWPSSIFLMATEGMGHSAQAFAILAYSLGAETILCVCAISLIWCVGWVIRSWRRSPRDGTTI